MRTILHSDLNNFYASVECLKDPALKKVPMAVCGDPAARETAPDADADLYRLFTSLPEAYRLPMVLHYVEGYAVSEVADMLRLGVNTVKSRLLRGRRLLGAALEEGEEG